ncbi:Immunity protein Imm1 [Actinopolyspora alba]|uniref:Immunity protein Imm1 n=1 Tax=Actinopolyspora alba TaxID=673379 RepID=A0A1I2A4L4_9ACTN|nr:Imm1 family immunity protein [Actinopolyspora alba]SFE38871.1 Immunity protein Imm1 [Actinopolyspora alba]
MTTTETETVVTAVFHDTFHYAHTPDELAELIRTITNEPPRPVCEVYVWDRPCRSFREADGPEFPDGRLRVSVRPDGWAALNYVDPDAPNGALVDTYNPDSGDQPLPALPFDPDGIDFPASASIPLDQAREAIIEYCRTGTRPESVRWQPGYWF